MTSLTRLLPPALRNRLHRTRQPAALPPLCGMDLPEALVRMAGLAGIETSAAALTAGLPYSNGQFDPRHAALALARIGLHGDWIDRPAPGLDGISLPAVALLESAEAVIVQSRRADGGLTLLTRTGTRELSPDQSASLRLTSILNAGSMDPVNGSDAALDRQNLRASPRRWLLTQLFADRRLLAHLCLTALMMNVLALAVPLYLRAIYDRVVPNLAIETLWALSIGVLIALVAEVAFKSIRTQFTDAIGLRLGHLVQHKVMAALLGSRLDKAPRQSGDVSIALRDIDALAATLPNAFAVFCIDVPFFAVFAIVLYHLGGAVVLAAVLCAAGIAGVGLWANLGLQKAAAKGTQISRVRANTIVDAVDGLATLKAYNGQGQFLRTWDKLADHGGMVASRTRDWIEKPVHASAFLVQLTTVLIIITGVYGIRDGTLSVGALVACTLIAGRAMVPVSNAVAIMSRAYQSLSQFAGLSGLMALDPEPDAADPTVRQHRIAGDIALHDVTFNYADQKSPALGGLNIRIRKGEKIALIGKSGSGKSTLLQLAGSLITPTSGTLLVDGFNASQYSSDQLRASITLLAQDSQLFDGTVYENLTLGLDTVNEAAVRTALRATGLEGWIAQQADGLSTKTGPRGVNLSGGQRQLVMLARALVRDSTVLLLDEPTAALDIGSEMTVIAGLRTLAADKTLILATHRLALLELVDRVIWMDNGRIVADKPRDEILAMFKAQSARESAPRAGAA